MQLEKTIIAFHENDIKLARQVLQDNGYKPCQVAEYTTNPYIGFYVWDDGDVGYIRGKSIDSVIKNAKDCVKVDQAYEVHELINGVIHMTSDDLLSIL